MKHKLLSLFIAATAMTCISTSMLAQSADNEDEVIKIDRWNQNAYREGEILVKFKADGAVQMRAPRRAKFQTSHVNAIDALFAELGVDSIEQLMPQTGHKNVGRRVKAYNGSEVEVKDLSKLYRLTLRADKAQDIHAAIERLKAQEEVEFAEPNYLVYTMALPYDANIPTADQATYKAEPLYSQQWGLTAINLPALWDKPKKSSKRPVIAILDTGVDIEHPDLAANIWTNTAESNGISGQDDDANGFKDDIHGWDFINQTGTIKDFNGHGTHCAGIAAAVGNNGIGITGANPDALIMPVTVMQSTGTGDVATIVKGIDYAAANGADVISMSIGSYIYSIAEEQALGRAYANAVIVAAAGNNHISISDLRPCTQHGSARCFPAAFTFVLGVEASADAIGNMAGFSNYDPDGPIYSEFSEEQQYNYELRAPGVQILSTFPGGRYKNLNGTSMACPMVAGAISRLIQCKEILSKEILFGDLIHTRVVGGLGNVNILAAFNIKDEDRKPELSIVRASIADTISGDGDGRADAGETLEIYPILKNAWGQAENIRFWIKTGYYVDGDWMPDDESLVTHLQESVDFGKQLSSYAKATSLNPWRMKISPDCADGRQINLTLFATCDNMAGTLVQRLVLSVENGVEIGGMITENMTLYPNVHYIVTNNMAIPEGITLTIKPGTVLKFKDGSGISVVGNQKSEGKNINGKSLVLYYQDSISSGKIIAQGKPDSMIVFTKADGETGDFTIDFGRKFSYFVGNLNNGKSNTHYLDTMPQFDSLRAAVDPDRLSYVIIENIYTLRKSQNPLKNFRLKDGVIKDCNMRTGGADNIKSATLTQCNIYNVNTYFNLLTGEGYNYGYYLSSNLSNLTDEYTQLDGNFGTHGALRMRNSNIFASNVRKTPYLFDSNHTTPEIIHLSPNYYGSSEERVIRKYIYDIEQNQGFGYFDISDKLIRPSSVAHGIVWKILVDGIDAQDEFELLPPIGVGTHKCEVYFNRPMDVSVAPTISFGVRQPYTQHQVADNGAWSADSTIYTAYFTIDGKSVTDGLNTFKVYGAEDNEHFEIPEENWRFHMEVAAAGSMSTGLMAEAGLGKVTLTWETDEEDFADLLGYNIYRWTGDTVRWDAHWENGQYVQAGWRIDTICINSSLIDAEDVQFIDYDVTPGKDYYYVIRQVTTSLSTYDLSNAVVARSLTAIKGDANGSMAVDVADVVTEVAYLSNQNPQPFIFEAADVNSDEIINILDIVGTINIILHPEANTGAINEGQATYSIENGILYVETDIVLGGVQCTFTMDAEQTITPLNALNGFEQVGLQQTEDQYLFMAYSMSGKTLGVGRHALLQIGDAELSSIVLSDAQGHNVPLAPGISTTLDGTKFVPGASKYIENGNLYIKLGDRTYSTMGTEIR